MRKIPAIAISIVLEHERPKMFEELKDEYFYAFFEPIDRIREYEKQEANVEISGNIIRITIGEAGGEGSVISNEDLNEDRISVKTEAYFDNRKGFLAFKGKDFAYVVYFRRDRDKITIDKAFAIKLREQISAKGYEIVEINGLLYKPKFYRLYTRDLLETLRILSNYISKLLSPSYIVIRSLFKRDLLGGIYYGPEISIGFDTVGGILAVKIYPVLLIEFFKSEGDIFTAYIALEKPEVEIAKVSEININESSIAIVQHPLGKVIVRIGAYNELALGIKELLVRPEDYALLTLLHASLIISLVSYLPTILSLYRDNIDRTLRSIIASEYNRLLDSLTGIRFSGIPLSKLEELVIKYGYEIAREYLGIKIKEEPSKLPIEEDFLRTLEEDLDKAEEIERGKSIKKLELIVTVFLAPILFTELALGFRDAASNRLDKSPKLRMMLCAISLALALGSIYRLRGLKAFNKALYKYIILSELLLVALCYPINLRHNEVSIIYLTALIFTEIGVIGLFRLLKVSKNVFYLSGIVAPQVEHIESVAIGTTNLNERNYLILEGISRIFGIYECIALVNYSEENRVVIVLGLARIMKDKVAIRSELDRKVIIYS